MVPALFTFYVQGVLKFKKISLQNAVCFIILTYMVPALFTFYVQGVLKFKKNLSSKCSLFHNSNVYGTCIIHILCTGCAKIKKYNSGAKMLRQSTGSPFQHVSLFLTDILQTVETCAPTELRRIGLQQFEESFRFAPFRFLVDVHHKVVVFFRRYTSFRMSRLQFTLHVC